MLFNHLKYNKMLRVGIHVATSLMAVSDVLLGTLGVSLGRFFLHQETESSNSTISGSSLRTTTLSVSRRYTGRKNSSRLFKCGPRDSDFLVHAFLAMRMQGDQLYASIGLLPEGAIVTHVITCQGRDHIVNVQSGRNIQ